MVRRRANDKLYWRGPVFGIFSGRAWSPLPQRLVEAPPVSIQGDARSIRSYTVTLEPHNRDWLFALEAPAALPITNEFRTRLTAEMQIVANDLVRQRSRYDMRSYTTYRFNADASEAERRNWLQLPSTYNPRTLQLADEIRSRSGNDADRVRTTLEHLRRGGYEYTLSPPRLGRNSIDEFLFDTRQGYCEHYASAFVFLMRALDVPARVVTGYQGGELNPVDGFLTIRQSDAHAWSEVWLQGRGWVRVDPTAIVAPLRIDQGASEIARQLGYRTAGRREQFHLAALDTVQLGSGAELVEPVGTVVFAGTATRSDRTAGADAKLGKPGARACGRSDNRSRADGRAFAAHAHRARPAGGSFPRAARSA